MPIRPPALDDRSFNDLVDEVLARIPAHTPEWTNPRPGDPGRTLVELFAWLTDTLLYRANLIPERQRLAFLRLLDIQMRPAVPARTIVSIAIDDEEETNAVVIRPYAKITGPVTFETAAELNVLPVMAEAFYKRALTTNEETAVKDLVLDLHTLYGLGDKAQAKPYVTTPIFDGGAPVSGGFEFTGRAVDKSLWMALLAPSSAAVSTLRAELSQSDSGGQQLISIGIMPSIETPALFEEIGQRAQIPHIWEISVVNRQESTQYRTLNRIADSTAGLTRPGVQRLAIPGSTAGADGFAIGAPTNDVRTALDAGVGDRPPRLDDNDKAARLVAWLRLRPTPKKGEPLPAISLSWVGINAAEVDQRQTLSGRVIGQSDNTANQQFELPGQSVEARTLQIQVEEPGRGYQPWKQIDDLALAGRDAAVYSLDGEAGTVSFGDNARGRIPAAGSRIRVAAMRSGGGQMGNLPPGSLAEISAKDLQGNNVTALKVTQHLAATGGEDAETLQEAEQRIPAIFRHRERAVTGEDYQHLVADTPGIRVGRAEVLPRFKPQQRRSGIPGVVSVLLLPFKATPGAPNPRPDRPFLEAAHAYLDRRRPLGTELYVIGCEYVPLGISVGVTVADGFGQEAVLNAVREALHLYLWPLPAGGPTGTGWPLGRAVRDRELEVAVARVSGVRSVRGINLFQRKKDDWQQRKAATANAPIEIELKEWQLPELLSVVAIADENPPNDLRGVPNPFADDTEVAVPVVPEVC